MFYSLHGCLTLTGKNLAVVECGGVGYACKTTASTLAALPKQGKEVLLYTYLHITDKGLDLFGFSSLSELNFFKMMITVNGVGPKAALAILSDLTPERFALCVAAGDYKTLTRAPGIGSKLAQRIVLELRDKVTSDDLSGAAVQSAFAPSVGAGAQGEAVGALEVLGYSRTEAAQAIAKLDPGLSVEEFIKGGLKALSSHR